MAVYSNFEDLPVWKKAQDNKRRKILEKLEFI
jgi:hypothetical protein